MPSASLRSRIQAFEALSSPPPPTGPTPAASLLESPISPSASAYQPISPLSAPAIDLKDWVVEDGPLDHTPSPEIPRLNGIHESSRTPSPSRKPTPAISDSSAPLISFEPLRPPLPPRKPSSNSVDRLSQCKGPRRSDSGASLRPPARSDSLTIEHTYPPSAHKFGATRVRHAPASSVSSFHSVSLSSDGGNTETHGPKISCRPPSSTFEADSSIADFDTASIAESFENVSVPSAYSPSTTIPFDWERALGKLKTPPRLAPPPLPNRAITKIAPTVPPKPLTRSVSSSSSSTATSTKTRRPPPPPPPLPPYQPRFRPSSSRASVVSTSASTSDRSSILSNATTTSRTSTSTRNSTQFPGGVKPSLLRQTPVPSPARSRYEALFDSAVKGCRKAEKKRQKAKLLAPLPVPARKSRQAAGWRGLSVDLIADPERHLVSPPERRVDESDSEEETLVGPGEKLNGRIVKHIWSASRLDRNKLGSIWNDCDPQCTGSIDRDAFVKGMWRIDEELRRAQLARRTSALTAASSQRIPHRPLLPSRSQTTGRLLI